MTLVCFKNTLGYLITNYQMFLKLQDFVTTKAQKRGETFKELVEAAFTLFQKRNLKNNDDFCKERNLTL